jgi:hypothetical protein
VTDTTLVEAQERQLEEMPAQRATFLAWSLDECVEGVASVWATTRRQAAKKLEEEKEEGREDASPHDGIGMINPSNVVRSALEDLENV